MELYCDYVSGVSSLISPSLLYALARAEDKDDIAFVDSSYFSSWNEDEVEKPNCLGFVEGVNLGVY